ncbi:MAG TPA: ABC transporter substrate-binding protein, partial [Anaerolineales bacterium]|nr:ABC transporter substrate-binding protein [Anaerolineales bacterium]
MKNKLLFIVVIIAMFVLAACGGNATPTSSGSQSSSSSSAGGGQSSSAMAMSVSKSILLDPALATDADSQSVNSYVYETLVKMQDNAPAPGLVGSVSASEDGLAYTLNLRPGVTFHDGTPVNADAVIANFNRWFDPADAAHG